jgi:hypothetical protein
MSGVRNFKGLAAGAAMALALAGCGTASDLFSGEARLFPGVGNMFKTPNLQVTAPPSQVNVTRPITPDDLVDRSGFCAGPAPVPAIAAAAPPPASPAPPPAPAAPASADGPMVLTPNASPPPAQTATVASTDPAIGSAATPAPAATAPLIAGGIALNMTECQVVRRAGHPESLEITADGHGERNVVLTYIHGERPGIYHFVAGRLKIIERAPEPPEPPKVKKKRRSRRRA